jgi:sarcosine oxidase/L-pipecolate oxidase
MSDIYKILRVAYGPDTVYQNLALEALEAWREWNKNLSASTDLPNGLSRNDVLYVNSGSLSVFTSPELPPFEQQSLENLTAAGQWHSQFVANKHGGRKRATELGFGYALDAFGRERRGKAYNALLDTMVAYTTPIKHVFRTSQGSVSWCEIRVWHSRHP